MPNFLAREIKNLNMRPKKILYVILGFVFLTLFVGFSLIEEYGIFSQFDPELTRYLQIIVPRNLDIPLSFFSVMGSIEITTIFLIVIALLITKKQKLIPYSLALFASVMIIELIAKLFIYHPAPPKEFFRYSLPFTTPHYINETFSFPSGHVARISFLAIISGVLAHKYIKNKNINYGVTIAIICFVTVMIISRVYLGEHWTSDVIGGFLLGTAFGFLAMVYYD